MRSYSSYCWHVVTFAVGNYLLHRPLHCIMQGLDAMRVKKEQYMVFCYWQLTAYQACNYCALLYILWVWLGKLIYRVWLRCFLAYFIMCMCILPDSGRWSLKLVLVINKFAASYLNTQRLNNSCLKSPASTLVDLTFQSRALRSALSA